MHTSCLDVHSNTQERGYNRLMRIRIKTESEVHISVHVYASLQEWAEHQGSGGMDMVQSYTAGNQTAVVTPVSSPDSVFRIFPGSVSRIAPSKYKFHLPV